MNAKTSKEVTDRQTSCQYLLAAFARQGGQVARSLHETSLPHLAGDDPGSAFEITLGALAGRLGASIDTLVALDEKVYQIEAHLDERRRKRRTAAQRLGRLVVRLRISIENQYQAPQIARLGFETPTPRKPVPLLRLAERLAVTFASEDLDELLGVSPFKRPFEPRSEHSELAAGVDELRRILRQIDEGQRDLDRARIDKRRAMKEHDVVFLHTARTFESFCRLVDENELADRVRPSLRRPGRIEKLEEVTGALTEPTLPHNDNEPVWFEAPRRIRV